VTVALASLNLTDNNNVNLKATTAPPGDDFQAPSFSVSVTKPQVALKDSAANNAVGGANQALALVLSIPGAGTASVDLQAFVNVAGQAASSFARVKYVMIRLLSAEDDAAGTACSGVEVKPHSTNGWTGLFKAATDTIVVGNGDLFKWATRKAGGITVDATHKVLLFTNVDPSVTAKVQVIIAGGSS
jgi:hypothetical protein